MSKTKTSVLNIRIGDKKQKVKNWGRTSFYNISHDLLLSHKPHNFRSTQTLPVHSRKQLHGLSKQ